MSLVLATNQYQILRVDGAKIKKARGYTPRPVVAKDANNAFTPMQLYTWEKEKASPDGKLIPVLAKALRVPIADITSVVEVVTEE